MMYLLFRYHGWKPTQYTSLKYGEKKIVNAFMHQQLIDDDKEKTSLNKILGL